MVTIMRYIQASSVFIDSDYLSGQIKSSPFANSTRTSSIAAVT